MKKVFVVYESLFLKDMEDCTFRGDSICELRSLFSRDMKFSWSCSASSMKLIFDEKNRSDTSDIKYLMQNFEQFNHA